MRDLRFNIQHWRIQHLNACTMEQVTALKEENRSNSHPRLHPGYVRALKEENRSKSHTRLHPSKVAACNEKKDEVGWKISLSDYIVGQVVALRKENQQKEDMEQEIQHPCANIMEQFAALNEEQNQQKDGRISQLREKKISLISNYDVITRLM